MISYTPDLTEQLRPCATILDTCVLVLASKIEELQNLLQEIRSRNGILLTTSSVHVELLRGARSLQESKDLDMLFKSLEITTIENADAPLRTSDGHKFMIMINKSTAKNPIYVDIQLLQLAACLRMPKHKVKLMTANFKDVPAELYQCEHLISTSSDNGLQTIGIYSIKQKYFEKRFSEIK